jgi:DNA-binding CsgD family transcriptional regulator
MHYPKLIDFLATAPDGSALAQHLVLEGDPDDECCGALIMTFDQEARTSLFGSFGIEESVLALLSPMSLWQPTPWTDAIRRGDTQIFETAAQMERVYPQFGKHSALMRASIVWQLSHDIHRVGSVQLFFTEGVKPDLADRLADTMALCALYLQLRRVTGAPRPASAHLNGEPHAARSEANGDALTDRQRRILELLARRMTNTQIGKNLGFSESTVKQETMRVYRHLGVSDRRAAVQAAIVRNILEVEQPEAEHSWDHVTSR